MQRPGVLQAQRLAEGSKLGTKNRQRGHQQGRHSQGGRAWPEMGIAGQSRAWGRNEQSWWGGVRAKGGCPWWCAPRPSSGPVGSTVRWAQPSLLRHPAVLRALLHLHSPATLGPRTPHHPLLPSLAPPSGHRSSKWVFWMRTGCLCGPVSPPTGPCRPAPPPEEGEGRPGLRAWRAGTALGLWDGFLSSAPVLLGDLSWEETEAQMPSTGLSGAGSSTPHSR